MSDAIDITRIMLPGWLATFQPTDQADATAVVPFLLPADWQPPANLDEARAELDALADIAIEIDGLFDLLRRLTDRVQQEHYELLKRLSHCQKLLTRQVGSASNTSNGEKRKPGRPKKAVSSPLANVAELVELLDAAGKPGQ